MHPSAKIAICISTLCASKGKNVWCVQKKTRFVLKKSPLYNAPKPRFPNHPFLGFFCGGVLVHFWEVFLVCVGLFFSYIWDGNLTFWGILSVYFRDFLSFTISIFFKHNRVFSAAQC